MEEFKEQYRCITADLRNAPSGQSTGPVEVDRPWESYADDQLGLMDHLGIDKFMVMGFCIGGPFIWSLLKRAIKGTYVSIEPFHLFRYLDEQAFRFNERWGTDAERFVIALNGIIGKRLTYTGLTGSEVSQTC